MKKKIQILTSYITGAGHKSITEALLEQFSLREDVELDVVEGFDLGKKMHRKLAELYGPVTKSAKQLWATIYDMQERSPDFFNQITSARIEEDFIKRYYHFKPDVLLSVHPLYVGSVLDIMEKYSLTAPMVVLLADIVDIADIWVDERCSRIFCPTEESYNLLAEAFHIPETKLKLTGFPVRKRFFANTPQEKSSSGGLRVLIMSGGEGSGNLIKSADLILRHIPDSVVSVVAGRNTRLRKRLDAALEPVYGDRIQITGFIDNVEDYMRNADLIIARASPNTIFEAVSCNTPMVITSALPGQEHNNPAFVKTHHIGAVSRGNLNLLPVIKTLLDYEQAQLHAIKVIQKRFMNPDAAKKIVSLLLDER
jgi:processive 1,2-diacylglycerol beta-glucosyltransferase